MVRVQITKNGLTPFKFIVSTKDIDLINDVDGNKFNDEIEIIGKVVDGGKLFNVEGTIKCQKSFICDRCLVQSTESQIHNFNEEVEIQDVDDGFIDVTEMIRDTVMAAQPIKNLCKEDCKGLCPICGANLNENECNCDRFVVDPRLEALKNFLQE